MASVVSIIPIVLLFVLMLGFKMAGHKSALLTLVVTVLLALHEDIIAVDSHQDDDENREHRLQDAFHHRPSRQGDHAILRMFRGNHA